MSLSARIANIIPTNDLPPSEQAAFDEAASRAARIAAEADAIRDEMVAALGRLLLSFPTDDDMLEAGWDDSEIREACDAYDAARAALARAKGQAA